MAKYVVKRIILMILTLFVIMTLCFVLIKLLEPDEIMDITQMEREQAIREALGYNKPILVQYAIYLKNIITRFDFGVSFKIGKYLIIPRQVQGAARLLLTGVPLSLVNGSNPEPPPNTNDPCFV